MQKCIVEYISEDDCIATENHVSKRHAIKNKYADVAQFRLIDFVNKRRAVKGSLALPIEQKGEEKINTPMWLNWQSS